MNLSDQDQGIATEHPQYTHMKKRWKLMRDCLGDEDHIKDLGEEYLPKFQGMSTADYKAYKGRARFPEITGQAEGGIVGLCFEQEPIGASDEIITNTGQNNVQLSREVLRHVCTRGRDVLVVDAPLAAEGGGPVTVRRYSPESLINWKPVPNNPGQLSLAVLQEDDTSDQSEYGHETTTVYRKYQLVQGRAVVSRWRRENKKDEIIGEPVGLPLDYLPVVLPGSVDLKPDCDPIPLAPVARCARSCYLKSACYEHALYLAASPIPWIAGVDQMQYDAIIKQGLSPANLWYLGETGQVGFLQAMTEVTAHERGMEEQLQQAETYAVRLTNESGVESGRALAMRMATQHASIFSMADSVSIAVNRAEQIRRSWNSERHTAEGFKLHTEFSAAHAAEQLINSLNAAINSGNSPREVLFEAMRRANLTELTDEQLNELIRRQVPANGPRTMPNRSMEKAA